MVGAEEHADCRGPRNLFAMVSSAFEIEKAEAV